MNPTTTPTNKAPQEPQEREAWYGGNKVPGSYLKRFLPSDTQPEGQSLPYELRLFMKEMT